MKSILIILYCCITSCGVAIPSDDTSRAARPLTQVKKESHSLSGTFARGAFEVELDSVKGTAVFTKVGKGRRHIGDTLFVVSQRTGAASWTASALDSGFHRRQESSVSIKGDILTVRSAKKGSYQWSRKMSADQPSVVEETIYTAPVTRRSGSGCATVQCHGTTRSGRQCRRSTSSCSGYCWQHE